MRVAEKGLPSRSFTDTGERKMLRRADGRGPRHGITRCPGDQLIPRRPGGPGLALADDGAPGSGMAKAAPRSPESPSAPRAWARRWRSRSRSKPTTSRSAARRAARSIRPSSRDRGFDASSPRSSAGRERVPLEGHLVHVAPHPVLSRLQGLDDGVIGGVEVLRGVLVLRVIAASHVAAREAEAKVNPGVSRSSGSPRSPWWCAGGPA